jgi:hypothetical protein
MAEPTGTLVPTQIPSLSEAADIQEAFRLYHYGAASGTNVGEYDPANANATNLVPQSIASYINTLNVKVAALEASPGIQPSQLNAKGALITATGNSLVSTLPVGSNGTVLVANSTAANGLSWQVPTVTPDNTVTLTGKTVNLLSNTLVGTTAQFNTALSDNDFATVAGVETLTNKTLTAPNINSPVLTGLYLLDSSITFEGSIVDNFEITLNSLEPTADRTISLPDTSGIVLTTGNLSSITSLGTLESLQVTGNAVYHTNILEVTTGSTAVISWDGSFISVNSSTPVSVGLPDTAGTSFPRGTQFTIFQRGTGQVTLGPTNATTVDVFGTPGLKLRSQFSSCTVIKLTEPGAAGKQQWAVIGDLAT